MASRLVALGTALGTLLFHWAAQPSEPQEAESAYHAAVFDAVTGEPVTEGYVVVYNTAGPDSVDPSPLVFSSLTSEIVLGPLPEASPDSPLAFPGFRFSADPDSVYEVRYRGPGYDAEVTLSEAVGGIAGLQGIRIDAIPSPREAAPIDTDGDGLYDIEEERLRLMQDAPDSDNDGLSDLFEAENGPPDGSNNLLCTDDADGDSVSNVEEFLGQSDPRVRFDPHPVWFISASQGDDSSGDGSFERPMRTLTATLERLREAGAFGGTPLVPPVEFVDPEHPVLLFLQAGEYVEDIVLLPGVYLGGMSAATVTVRGSIEFTKGNRIADITLRPPNEGSDSKALLEGAPESESGTLDRVNLVGGLGFNGAGALIYSEQGAPSRFRDCQFSRFNVDLEVRGVLPTLLRCTFSSATTAAIAVRSDAVVSNPGALGNQADPATGWNNFEPFPSLVLLNESGSLLQIENNDWNTSDPEDILRRIIGSADFDPALTRGELINISTLVCTLSQAGSQHKRITDAVVQVEGRTSLTLKRNERGVYVFDALPTGRYTVKATAPGYRPGSRTVELQSDGITYLLMPLQPNALDGDVDGDARLNAIDIQLVTNAVLGIPLPPGVNADMNGDGKKNAVDVQFVVNAVLAVA